MNELNHLAARLRDPGDLPELLAAAYSAFDGILLAIRGREDPATGMFAALVMSAASAAEGRDAIIRAPSLPMASLGRATLVRRAGGAEPGIRDLAAGLTQLAGLLAEKLAAARQRAALESDRDACVQAAQCALHIRALLGGAGDD